jgi:tetratricopeptide (TPR) repeat protein
VENVNRRESWSRALRAVIGSRRLLLVIDDAWSPEDALAFQVGGSQCAHLLTTRLPNVAFAFAREGTLAIPELQNSDGLSLLARFVPHLVRQDEESAQALVQAVGGSPLALTLMGNYLAAQAFTGQARRLRQALAQLRDAERRMRLSVPVAPAERSSCLPEDTPLSLYAAIEVSVHHLDVQDHATLCALAAFPPKPNSFSEEAALAVSATSVERLDALWDAGLLESSGSDRYTLHQTIVDYAKTRCKDMRARQRLLSYMLWYIQESERDYEALEREQSNILAALDSAEELGMPQALLQGAIHLTSFMRVRGHYALAHRLLSQAQQVALQQKDALGHLQVLRHLADFAEQRGDYAQAERYSQEGLDLARQLGSPRNSESALLTTLGLVSFHRGDYERAKNLFEEGLRVARKFGNNERICTLLTHLGRVLHFQGHYCQAEALYQEGLVLAQASEQQELLNLLLIYIGGVHLSQGNHLQAQRYYEEGLILARSLGHREYLEALLNDMGILAYNRGDLEQTVAYFQEGLALARQIGHGDDCCLLLSNLGEIAVKQGNYAQAEEYLREGIELARYTENRNRLTHLLSNLGSALGQQGDYERANMYFRESLDMAHAIGAPWHIYSALMSWGEIHLKYQQLHAASAAFHEILAQEKSPAGEPELIAEAKYGLARVANLQGRIEEALHFAQESEAHFAALGHFKATTVREWWQRLCQPIASLPSLIYR